MRAGNAFSSGQAQRTHHHPEFLEIEALQVDTADPEVELDVRLSPEISFRNLYSILYRVTMSTRFTRDPSPAHSGLEGP